MAWAARISNLLGRRSQNPCGDSACDAHIDYTRTQKCCPVGPRKQKSETRTQSSGSNQSSKETALESPQSNVQDALLIDELENNIRLQILRTINTIALSSLLNIHLNRTSITGLDQIKGELG